MPQDFWAEALACAVYLLNPCQKQSVCLDGIKHNKRHEVGVGLPNGLSDSMVKTLLDGRPSKSK